MPTWWWGDGAPTFTIAPGSVEPPAIVGPTLIEPATDTATTITPATVPSGEVVIGPMLSTPAVPGEPPLVQVLVGGDALTRDSGRTWRDLLSQTGTGQFVLPSGDEQLDALGYGERAVFTIDGRECFTMLVERKEDRRIDPGEEAAQVTTVSGRGHIAELEDVLTYPDLGAEIPSRLGQPYQGDRVFNFAASSGVNDTDWPDSVATLPRYGAASQRFALPDGWPDLTSRWIWDRDSSVSVPQGTAFFRRTFAVPSAGRYGLWVTGDDDYEVWLDGALITTHEGRYTGGSEHFDIELGAHFHLLAAKVFNRGGRAGFNATLLPILGTGHYGSPVMRTTAGWRCLAYHEPTMFTIGKVLGIWLAEAHARGSIPDWSRSFTDLADSNGRPWPRVRDFTIPVGQNGLAMLSAMADQHIEFSAAVSAKVLHAYVIGTAGSTSSSVGEQAVNLGELTVAMEG